MDWDNLNTAAKLQDWIRSQENQEEAFAKLLTAYDQKEPVLFNGHLLQ
jgi:hypothetical protein